MKNCGAKGSDFERVIAKDLSLWISDGESNKHIWRTVSSGSWGTIRNTHAECGDLKAMTDVAKPLFKHFNIECRTGKCMDIMDLFYGRDRNNGMFEFVKEGIRNQDLTGRNNLWIFREIGHPALVMMKYEVWNEWFNFLSSSTELHVYCNVDAKSYALVIVNYDNFKKFFKKERLFSEK